MAASIRDRLTSRLAHLSFLITRPMTLGVRAVVIDRDDRVLLVRHGYVSGWHFPGGGVEVGETCMEALARELEEEASVALEGPPLLHGVFFNAQSSRRDHVAVYVVRTFRGPRRTRARLGNRGSALFSALGAAGRNDRGHTGQARRDLRIRRLFRPLVIGPRRRARAAISPHT